MNIETLRLLVCGGRGHGDDQWFFGVIDALFPTHIIASGLGGAPQMALRWAELRGVESTMIRSNSSHYRDLNQRLLDEGRPDLVLLFPDDEAVRDMHKRAWANRIRAVAVGNWWK